MGIDRQKLEELIEAIDYADMVGINIEGLTEGELLQAMVDYKLDRIELIKRFAGQEYDD